MSNERLVCVQRLNNRLLVACVNITDDGKIGNAKSKPFGMKSTPQPYIRVAILLIILPTSIKISVHKSNSNVIIILV